MSGWPLRPDRDSFGPEVQNTSPVRDNRRQWDASIANLIMHQCAGLGLVSARSALVFTADASPVVLARVEAWNPKRLVATPFDDPGIVQNATGDFLVTYPTPVPDEAGANQAVSFAWALGFASDADPSVFRHVQAAVDAQTNRIRVCVFDSSMTLVDGSTVVLLGW
jgi:hypothetical protein